MTNLKRCAAAWLLILTLACGVAHAQAALMGPQSAAGGRYVASAFGNWRGSVITGNGSTGTASVTIATNPAGTMTLIDGRQIPFPTTAPFPPIIFDYGAGNAEIVTPTGITLVAGVVNCEGTCVTITGSFANTHGAAKGTLSVASGSFGLQEAINYAHYFGGGGVVALDPAWAIAANNSTLSSTPQSVIAAAIPFADTPLESDFGQNIFTAGTTSGPPPGPWFASRPAGTGTTAAAAASTLTPVACPSALAGLAAGAFFAKSAYVDVDGGVSQSSAETASATTTAALACLTLTAPAAAAGQVGFIVYLTQPGGGSGNETYYPLSSTTVTGCTLTAVERMIPACIVTSATYGQTGATITLGVQNASTTAKVIGAETVNRTAFAYQAVGGQMPAAFANVVLSQPATGTAAGTYQIIGMALPANFFNFVGEKRRLCISGHDTFGGVIGQTLAFTVSYGPYNNSDTALIAFGASPAGTATAGTQTVTGCAELNVTASGATGTIQAHGALNINLANSNVSSPIQDQQAAATSLPLSTQQWLRVQLVVGAQALAAGFVVDSFSIEPAS